MKTKLFAFAFVLILTLGTGCKKFLMVDPKSSIGEEELFRSEVGFQQALTGVYSQMAGRNLYGDALTMSFASLIAQNYNPSLYPNFAYPQTVNLNFWGNDVIRTISAIWSSAYNAIAGTNNILNKIDGNKTIFTENRYALIKGEALGMRAYLHFDLLRLFGANYASGANKKAIPYRTQVNGLSQLPATVEEVTTSILNDLKEAEALLKDKDPILTDKNRRFRMNYYAIKGLQARVHMFKGDKPNAHAAASEVVNSGAFVLTPAASLSADATVRDRTFSTEQLFALRVREMREWVESGDGALYFKPSANPTSILSLSEAQFKTLFETASGGSTDVRYVNFVEKLGDDLSNTYFYNKYWQTWGGAEAGRLDQTVPLMRLSEMYYILAETAETVPAGVDFLNIVREKRIIPLLERDLSSQRLTEEITKEYQKDFYAEGQLFYYYKRKVFTRMLFSTRFFSESRYIIPIPNNEIEFNPNYN